MNIMEIIKKNIIDLTSDDKEKMFDMYKLSYGNAGEPLWFKTYEELFARYPCFITYSGDFKVYAMFQFKQRYNKISLVCHDGTNEGKQLSIQLRYEMITQRGYILEASGAVSWLLRKRDTPIIKDKDAIEKALDLVPDNSNDYILLNDTFDIDNKLTQHYTRVFTTPNGQVYRSPETLFGSSDCEFNESDDKCTRTCKELIGGGNSYEYLYLKYKKKYSLLKQ